MSGSRTEPVRHSIAGVDTTTAPGGCNIPGPGIDNTYYPFHNYHWDGTAFKWDHAMAWRQNMLQLAQERNQLMREQNELLKEQTAILKNILESGRAH